MDNTERALDNDGYRPCLVRMCGSCGGTGQYVIQKHTAATSTGVNGTEQCELCINGFQFHIPETNDFINWLALRILKHVEVNAGGQLQTAFMQAVVRATEHQMTSEVGKQFEGACSCTHAPEQHNAAGCMVVSIASGRCPCRWKRL